MKTRHYKKFTNKEDDIIRDHYPNLHLSEIAELIGRTKKSVVNRAYIIRVENKRKIWSPLEIDYLTEFYNSFDKTEGFDLNILVERLGRHRSTICKKAKELGLTNNCRKATEQHKVNSGNGLKEHYKTHEHPKGMLGKHHTPEVCEQMGNYRKGRKLNLSDGERKARAERSREMIKKLMNGKNMYSRTKSGIREDLGIFVRSNWEANFARILNFLELSWEYETKTFKLKTEKYGEKEYIMDFFVKDGIGYMVEVKGWLDSKSKIKIKMFKECYPKEFYQTKFLINKEGDKAHQWLNKLGAREFIFYNELRNEYRSKIKWEGT